MLKGAARLSRNALTRAAAMASSSSSSAASPAGDAAHSVTINGAKVPVLASDPAVPVEKALASKPFQEWTRSMDPQLVVKEVTIQGVDMFGPRVGFVKFSANVEFHGRRMPGVVFMRGGAVAILVILKCEGERWVVCCRQPRIPIGRADYLEIPAGMLDDSGQFAGVAAKELREETGIVIGESDMVDLTALAFGLRVPPPPPTGGGGSGGGGAAAGPTDEELRAPRGMYPSVGGCDEFIRLYSFSKSVTREELAALQGKATGNIDEGEVITLDLLPYDDLWRKSSDAKTLSAVLLYEKLAAAGLLTV